MRPYALSDPYQQAVLKHKNNRKRWLTIGISSFILVIVVVCAAIGVVTTRNKKAGSDETNNSNLQSACQSASYPQTCESTLAKKDGSNSSNPFIFAKISVEAAWDHIQEAYDLIVNLTSSTNDVNTTAALADCKANLEAALDRLNLSFSHSSHFSLQSLTSDIYDDLNAWISAALTSQTTCMDSFTDIKNSISEQISSTGAYNSEILSNALAIVDWIFNLFRVPTTPARRLMSLSDLEYGTEEEYPSWVSGTQRRLMTTKPHVALIYNATVAKDGSGQYKTIGDAVAQAPVHSTTPYIIHIKAGWYGETVIVPSNLTNLVLVGDGVGKTIIADRKNVGDGGGMTTFQSATVAIQGDNFMARDLTIQNYAGPAKFQAVALRVSADYAVFYHCSLEGYQDTLYTHSLRQFYRECTIKGTVDFIFGNSAAVFQACTLVGLVGLPGQQVTFTAQGKTDKFTKTGLSFHLSTVTGSSDLMNQINVHPAYLGRPWKQFSTTVFMYCTLTSVVNPAGWLPWNGTQFLSTVTYGEYANSGAGSSRAQRVYWSKLLTFAQAKKFSVNNFIGKNWISPKGVPFQGSIP